MKNKTLIFIIIILVIISVSLGIAYINKDNKNNKNTKITNVENTEHAVKSSENFIRELFTGSEGVLDYSTGTVKRNLSLEIEKLSEHDIIDIVCTPEYISDKFATVNTIVEYLKSDGSVDVDFYKFSLIKENNDFLVYELVNNTVFSDDNIDSTEISTIGLTDTLNSYFQNINNNELSKSVEHLIGKAKADHVRSFQFVSKAMGVLEYEILDIKHDIISPNTGRLVVVRSNYLNNGRDTSIISTLFKTTKGWKIYEIKQI